MQFSIREARKEDYDGICPFFEELLTMHLSGAPGFFRRPDGPVCGKEYISGLIAGGSSTILVAEHDDRLIGFATVILRHSEDISVIAPRFYAVVDNLGVSAECRRSGVGRALMQRAEQWAHEKGASGIELIVWEFNQDAVAFYDHIGYQTVSRKMRKAL